ncbi:Rho GTPase-activating protein 29, variant 2 [Balamuthia mandrillaris]
MADAREGITAKAANPPTCFGLPLEEAMQLPNQKTIPTLVKQMIVFLNTEAAIKTEGLFRVSPTLTKLKELRQACERPDFSFAADLDPNLVGALLKSYLGELPEPLLTFGLYSDFLAVTSLNEAQAKSQRLQELMQELPPHNRVLAEILFLFLARMVEHVEHNKMTASNLAMIFGPLLLRPQIETIDSMMHGPKVTAIVKHLVEHYDQIFRKGKGGTITTTAGASLPSPFSSSSSTPTVAGMRLLQGENAEEKLVQIVKALDDAIALVQNKLAGLRQQLEQTQSMEEAIQIARKIRTAKRILFLDGEGRGGGIMPSSTSSRMTPKQLNRQHRRSIAILAAASPQTPLRPESSASALKGRRRTMEDAHVLVDDLRKHFPNAAFPAGSSACSFSFYGVYDGWWSRVPFVLKLLFFSPSLSFRLWLNGSKNKNSTKTRAWRIRCSRVDGQNIT